MDYEDYNDLNEYINIEAKCGSHDDYFQISDVTSWETFEYNTKTTQTGTSATEKLEDTLVLKLHKNSIYFNGKGRITFNVYFGIFGKGTNYNNQIKPTHIKYEKIDNFPSVTGVYNKNGYYANGYSNNTMETSEIDITASIRYPDYSKFTTFDSFECVYTIDSNHNPGSTILGNVIYKGVAMNRYGTNAPLLPFEIQFII